MEILRVSEVTDELVAAFGRLVPQLSSTAPPPTRAQLEAVVASAGCTLLVARNGALEPPIVGTLTLGWYQAPTGLKVWIEDVVVDHAARGRGVGEALVREALACARTRGAKSVNLTSRGEREAANRLYQRLGFRRRDTNAYRYDLG
jgi:ribosomal protein S18 acetylase RimI-like enzyme